MKKSNQKMYVIKKFVMANSAQQAIRKERKAPVDSVWIDDDWAKGNSKTLESAIGFTIPTEED